MNRQTATDEFKKWFTPLIGGAGFEWTDDNDGGCFTRLAPGCRQTFGLAVWDYDPNVEVAVFVSVRLHAVEEVYHLFSDTQAEFQGWSDSIDTPLYFWAGGPSRVRARDPEDLLPVFVTWEEAIRSEVLPYLNLATDVVSLDKLVNVKHAILNSTNPPNCFMHQIIVAKLAANPAFDDLVSFHRAEMRDMGYDTVLYDRVVDYLSRQ